MNVGQQEGLSTYKKCNSKRREQLMHYRKGIAHYWLLYLIFSPTVLILF